MIYSAFSGKILSRGIPIDQFGFKSMASAIPGGLPRQTKDDAMPQAYTCS